MSWTTSISSSVGDAVKSFCWCPDTNIVLNAYDSGSVRRAVHGLGSVQHSSAGMCLSDMFGKMDPELIHQRCQANTKAHLKLHEAICLTRINGALGLCT